MNYKAKKHKPLRACRMCKYYKYLGNSKERYKAKEWLIRGKA